MKKVTKSVKATKATKKSEVISNIPSFEGIENSKKNHEYYNRNYSNVALDTKGSLLNGLKSLLSFEFDKFEQIEYLISSDNSKICKLPLKEALNEASFKIVKSMINWYFSGSYDSWNYTFNTDFSIDDILNKEFSLLKERENLKVSNESIFYNSKNNTLYVKNTSKYFTIEFLLYLLENNDF